ncbi:substrate-binding domain-containing protein [Magnetospirillum sulfuroxidans]|uniref:Substrate-binding domain-containing protein n=1 Tax=Magnetospirillum sulfuroxidans TaxID=611300 RepID=A0ABS5I779_9PROT|nr:substrate-binding domain-containing protein [Magnetospirillum sulfuroxidans]MBR9970285.1 substrate-binding domain-containing protein [Magnetospirillum sulfuroxidans]
MRKVIVVFLLVVGWTCPLAAQNLRIGGTGAGLEISRVLAEEFARLHAGTTLWVPESLGTTGGIKALAAGRLDVAVTMRKLNPGEVEDGVSIAFCRTPWTFFAHGSRRDIRLSQADLPGLFQATLPPFAQGEVRPLLRPANETSVLYLQERFPELPPLIEAARQMRGAVLAATDQDAMDAVENGASLVGFGPLAAIVAERRKLRIVPFEGHDAGRMAADYPFWTTLYLAFGPNSTAQGRAFVDFVRSPAAVSLLHANGCRAADGAPS